jgi:hypothetical protein
MYVNKHCVFHCSKSTTNILHVDVLYNNKRKKYKTVCAELAVTKSPSTEWSWFCIELIILFLYLLCSWIIAIFKECLIKSFFCLTRPRLVPTIYRTRGEHANHSATDFYLIFINFFNQNFLLSFKFLPRFTPQKNIFFIN